MKYYDKENGTYIATRKNANFKFYCREINGFAESRESLISKIKSEVYHGLKMASLTMKPEEFDDYMLDCDACYFRCLDAIVPVECK